MPLRWTLQDETSHITVSCEAFSGSDAMLAHIRDGIVSATDLAQTLNVSTSTVSKWAQKLKRAGLITKKGRDYEAVDWPM
jgi:DNA-binding transcriptional regulator YiaG